MSRSDSTGRGKAFLNFFLNANFYQAGWFCCVLGAVWGWPWFGLAALPFILGLQLLLPNNRRLTLICAALSLGVGIVVDSLLGIFGVFEYTHGAWPEPLGWLAPPWLLALWAMFGTTLNGCLSFMGRRPWAGAALGFLAGPLAYYGGIRLQAVDVSMPLWQILLVLALVWAALLPALGLATHAIARRLPGAQEPTL